MRSYSVSRLSRATVKPFFFSFLIFDMTIGIYVYIYIFIIGDVSTYLQLYQHENGLLYRVIRGDKTKPRTTTQLTNSKMHK